MSSERCPLSSYGSPGFYHGENIPDFCTEQCEERWERAIIDTIPEHEEYPSFIASTSSDCHHPYTEYGNSSLQAVAVNSSVRLYTTTERCMSCSEEIAEDTFQFNCPNP